MSGRRDYYRDPAAPMADSLVPGGSAVVVDEHGRVRLQRRADSGILAVSDESTDVRFIDGNGELIALLRRNADPRKQLL